MSSVHIRIYQEGYLHVYDGTEYPNQLEARLNAQALGLQKGDYAVVSTANYPLDQIDIPFKTMLLSDEGVVLAHTAERELDDDFTKLQYRHIPSRYITIDDIPQPFTKDQWDLLKKRAESRVKFWLDPNKKAQRPKKANEHSAGYDLFCSETVIVPPHHTDLIETGVHIEIPVGYWANIKPRSSTMQGVKHTNDSHREAPGLLVVEGVIDCDYRGELLVSVVNIGRHTIRIHEGDRIAQLVFMERAPLAMIWAEVSELEQLSKTVRGDGGFGSTND